MLYHLRDQVEKFRKLLDGGGTITFDSVIGDGDLEKPQRLAKLFVFFVFMRSPIQT